MKVERILTYSPEEAKVRVLRVVWTRGKVGDGAGYCSKLTFNIVNRIVGFERGFHSWRFTLCGLQMHYDRSYGGIW